MTAPLPGTAAPPHAVWIDNAKIAAIAAVVMLHVGVLMLNEAQQGSAVWWQSMLLSAATRWGVPVFVMLSGAALLGPDRSEAPGVFYRKRLSKILVPLLFWSAFYTYWALLPALAKGQPIDWAERLQRWVQGRPYYHLWFLYMIVGLYVITPWLRLAMRDMAPSLLRRSTAALFVLMATSSMWRGLGWDTGNEFFLMWAIDYLPYFLLGACLVRHPQPARTSPAGDWLASFGALTFLCAGYAWMQVQPTDATWAAPMKSYWLDSQGLPVILLSVFLMPLLRRWQRPCAGATWTPFLASLSFGIYLVHPAVLDVLRVTRLHQRAWTWPAGTLMLAGATVATLALSLAVTLTLSKLPYLRRLV